MRVSYISCAPVVAGALILSACGGGSTGGGAGVVSTPAPQPAPTPTPTPTPTNPLQAAVSIFPGLSSSQTFTGQGASVNVFSSAPSVLRTGDSSQLAVRYDAGAKRYEVSLPGSASWAPIATNNGGPPDSYATDGVNPTYLNLSASSANGYKYAAVGIWQSITETGGLAFGMATPASGIPLSGSASFNGVLAGRSTETINDAWGPYSPWIAGSIALSFDFGAGTLSGSISPQHIVYEQHDLPTLAFTNTIYSSGSSTFSGRFASNLSGANSFSGRFAGPNAEEVMGQFAFPYTSPLDGKSYEAGGGFVGKRP